MKNQGKLFEEDFRKSLNLDDQNLFYYRFKDSTAGWNSQANSVVRFSVHNISDCMIFQNGKLILCELKSHKGKSLPLSCIRENQLKEMYEASKKENVYPYLVIFFSEEQECYAVDIKLIDKISKEKVRKSISLLFCKNYGIKIDCHKLQTHFRFDLNEFFKKV